MAWDGFAGTVFSWALLDVSSFALFVEWVLGVAVFARLGRFLDFLPTAWVGWCPFLYGPLVCLLVG